MHRLSPTILLVVLATGLTAQQVVHVDATATGAANGTSWTDAFPSLQQALALPGSVEIWVAAGTYHPHASDPQVSFVLRAGASLFGGFTGNETSRWQRDARANPTILSGDLAGDDIVSAGGRTWYQSTANFFENSACVVRAPAGVDATAVLDGFVISHGYAFDTNFQTIGAGMYVEGSPTIVDCTFTHNLAYYGAGALMVASGAPSLRSCRIVENFVSAGWGGGAYVATTAPIDWVDCAFTSNTCRNFTGGAGGGLYVDFTGTAVLRGCEFRDNESRMSFGGPLGLAMGGGLFAGSTSIRIERCTFEDNTSNVGGGAWVRGAVVENSVFDHNTATNYNGVGGSGAGLMAGTSSGTVAVDVRNCTFVNGIASDDAGGAFFSNTTGQVTRCVFWNNSDSVGQIGRSQCRGANPRYSCVQNLLVGVPGEDAPDPANYPGSFDLPPLFVAMLGADGQPGGGDDDLRLLTGSPCIDATPSSQLMSGTDRSGTPRTLDGNGDLLARIDLGAFERGLGSLAVDVTRYGSVADVMISVTGAAGRPVALGIGSPGPEQALAPFGALFFDLAGPVNTFFLGVVPATVITTTPVNGTLLQLQAMVLDFQGAATLTNPVTVRL